MHQAMVDIVVDAIIERFETEDYFCKEFLEISLDKWDAWKKGTELLSGEEMQKIKSLFSDYEWMLTQKILRQTVLFPEKRNYVVPEYKRLKTMIAKHWVKAGGLVELISQKDSLNKNKNLFNKAFIDLKISLQYGEWGYDDILMFHLPAVVQRQIEGSQVDLLAWVDTKLTSTYLNNEEEWKEDENRD